MTQTAYFGAGCFWNAELVYSKIDGVKETEVGFCSNTSESKTLGIFQRKNQVEAVKVVSDENKVSFEQLIDSFWATHDPHNKIHLKANYGEKSIIFVMGKDQEQTAKQLLDRKVSETQPNPVLTEVRLFEKYKKAPTKDQQYFFKGQ